LLICSPKPIQLRKALLQLHIAIILAGFTGILGKLIDLNEGWLVWYRMGITVLALAIWLLIKKELKWRSLQQKWELGATGALIALHWVCFFGSVKYSNVSIALVCFSATGFFTALLDPLLRKLRVQKYELLLGLLSMLGIYLIFNFNTRFHVGIILGVLSAILASLFTIRNKQIVSRLPVQVISFYELAGGWLILTLLLPLYEYYFPGIHHIPSSMDWLWLLILALVCTVLGLYLQFNALRHVSSFTTSLLYNLEPLYGVALAFIIFHENEYLGKWFYYGLSLIVLSVILQTWRIRKQGRQFD